MLEALKGELRGFAAAQGWWEAESQEVTCLFQLLQQQAQTASNTTLSIPGHHEGQHSCRAQPCSPQIPQDGVPAAAQHSIVRDTAILVSLPVVHSKHGSLCLEQNRGITLRTKDARKKE